MLTRHFLVTGTLKGYDQLMNLVLDNVEEVTRGTHFSSSTLLDPSSATNATVHQTKMETPPPAPSASSLPAALFSSSSPPSTAAKKSRTPSCKPRTTSKSSDYITITKKNRRKWAVTKPLCTNCTTNQSDSQAVSHIHDWMAKFSHGTQSSKSHCLLSSLIMRDFTAGWLACSRTPTGSMSLR